MQAIEMEGTITGEHGIGLEYRDMLVNELGVNYIDAMRQIKLALDPLCLLNPDKIFRLKWALVPDGDENKENYTEQREGQKISGTPIASQSERMGQETGSASDIDK